MSGRAVARGAIVCIAATLVFAVPARANDAAHKMAEKFAGEVDGTEGKKKDGDRKAAETKKPDAESSEAAAKREADEARKQEARKKAEAARKAAEAKRRAAAKAAEDARRAAERRSVDEAEMLARARREADEMRAAAEEARLTEDARRLIEQAEIARAKAEELLAGEGKVSKQAPAPTQAAAVPESTKAPQEEPLTRQRSEETRRLVEKLSRVRQIRESRLAGQARREAEEPKATATPNPETPAAVPPGGGAPPPAATAAAAPVPADTPPQPPAVVPAPALSGGAPPSASAPLPAPAQPPPAKPAAVATAPTSPLPPTAQAPATATPADDPSERKQPETKPHVAEAPTPSAPRPSPASAVKSGVGRGATRVTVLLVMEPGTYGIRRGGAKVADPVLCTREGCYVSAGADRPAVFLPGRKALGIRNTWGARAGACSNMLGCVFRGVELGVLPGFLQPVDLHILKHDLRLGHAVLADSDCRTDGGRLSCRHGIYADDYSMWIIPESLAATAGSATLQRALSERLNGPRSAELAPRR
jgi:hypothetical protein